MMKLNLACLLKIVKQRLALSSNLIDADSTQLLKGKPMIIWTNKSECSMITMFRIELPVVGRNKILLTRAQLMLGSMHG